jgi:hypothetical protein
LWHGFGTANLCSAITQFVEALQIARADARTRTGDPFITSEVLYQLSYVGRGLDCTDGDAAPLV